MAELESPYYIRMSAAAAITLGLKNGLFYRNAKLWCINLLLTYKNGCSANCAYCGLGRDRKGIYEKKSFIRVDWPIHSTDLVINKIIERKEIKEIQRICISMITHKKACQDTLEITKKIREKTDIPISLLITPTLINEDWLKKAKISGADKIGIAIDCATPELFDKLRGRQVKGPHRWEKYWHTFEQAIDIFGKGNVGAHFIVGLGESEKDMVEAIQKIHNMGGDTHLFSFYPEKNSLLENKSPPPIEQYRRIQLARYLIDNNISCVEKMKFNYKNEIENFGLTDENLLSIIESGEPFMTSGCTGKNGKVACNRPYGNYPPGDEIRNYPFPPDANDIKIIKSQLIKFFV